MALISVSRGSASGGRQLALKIAEHLGYQYVRREDLLEQARECGVDVNRLQEAVDKPPLEYEELKQERQAYLNCVRVKLCERILDGNIVYDGHAGHMLLAGIPNILRVRAVADSEYRIHYVMTEYGFSRREAVDYITQVDRRRDRWARFLYNVDWRDEFFYDVLINVSQTGVNHGAETLAEMARHEEYQLSKDAIDAITDLRLASRVHFKVLRDDRTRDGSFTIMACQNKVYITGKPSESELIPAAKEIAAAEEGVETVYATVADGAILFLQDRYRKTPSNITDVIRLAESTDSAVRVMRVARPDSAPGTEFFDPSAFSEVTEGMEVVGTAHTSVRSEEFDQTISHCADELDQHGRLGGVSTFYGTADWLMAHLQANRNFHTVVLGELFAQRAPTVRARLRSQLAQLLAERLKTPVVTAEEIARRTRLSLTDIGKIIALVLAAAAVLVLLLRYQNVILPMLTGQSLWYARLMAGVVVLAVALLFAWLYGTFIKSILKLIRLE